MAERLEVPGTPPESEREGLSTTLGGLVRANVDGTNVAVRRAYRLVTSAGRQAMAGRGRRIALKTLVRRFVDFGIAVPALETRHRFGLVADVMTALEQALGLETEVRSEATTAGRPELRVQGRLGQRVRAPIVMTNSNRAPLAVGFEARPLESWDGPCLPLERISIFPSKLTIPAGPGRRAVAHADIHVAETLEAGETYGAAIRLLGVPDREVAVIVHVLAAAERDGEDPPDRQDGRVRPLRVVPLSGS